MSDLLRGAVQGRLDDELAEWCDRTAGLDDTRLARLLDSLRLSINCDEEVVPACENDSSPSRSIPSELASSPSQLAIKNKRRGPSNIGTSSSDGSSEDESSDSSCEGPDFCLDQERTKSDKWEALLCPPDIRKRGLSLNRDQYMRIYHAINHNKPLPVLVRQDEAFLRKLQRIEARHIASYQPAPDIAKTTKKATSHAGKSPKGKKAAKAAGIASRTGTSPLAQGCLIASDPDTKTKSSKGLKASKDVTKRPLRRHPASIRVDPEAALKENWTIKDRTTPQKRSPRASNTTAVKLSDLARLVKAKTNEVKVKPAPAQQAGQPKVTTFQLQGNYPGQKRIPLVVVTPADANSSHKPATSEKRRRAFAVLPANSDKQVDSDSEEFSSYDPMRSWYGAVNRNMPPTPLKRKAAVLIEDIPVPQLTFDSSLSDIADDETDDESGNDTCESARDGATRPLPALFDDEHDDTRMDDPHVSSSDGAEDDTEECKITNRKISSGRKRRIQESDSDTSDDDDNTCEDSAIEDAKDDNDVDELSTDTKDLIPVPADLLPHIGEIKQAYHGDIEIEDFGEYSPYAQLYWGAPVETNDKTNDIDEQVFARELLASLKVLDPACSQAPTTEMATAPTESAEVPQVTTHKAPLANIRAKGSTRASAKRRFTAGVLDDRTDKVNKQPLSISSFLSGMLLGADEDDTSDRFESESVKVPAKRRHQVPGSARSAIPLGLDLPRSPPRKRARVNFQQDAADTFGFMPVMPLAASQTA